MLTHVTSTSRLNSLLQNVQSAEGKVDLGELEASLSSIAAYNAHHTAVLDKETHMEYSKNKALFDLMMQKLMEASNWTEEMEKGYIEDLGDGGDAYINDRDQYGHTLLMFATLAGKVAVVQKLLDVGADSNAQDAQGFCCLHFACAGPGDIPDKDLLQKIINLKESVASAILKSGAKPSLEEGNAHCTPLHYAAASNLPGLCDILIEHGASVSARDSNGFTPVDHARSAGYTELAEKLAKHSSAGSGSDAATAGSAWQEHKDAATGRIFYFNHKTHESTWTKPDELKTPEESSQSVNPAPPASAPPSLEDPSNTDKKKKAPAELRGIWQRTGYKIACRQMAKKVKKDQVANTLKMLAFQAKQLEDMRKKEMEKKTVQSKQASENRAQMEKRIKLLELELQEKQRKIELNEQHKKSKADWEEREKELKLEAEKLRKQAEEAGNEAKTNEAAIKELEEKHKAEREAYEAEYAKKLQDIEKQTQDKQHEIEEEIKKEHERLQQLEGELQVERKEKKKLYIEVEDLKGTIRVYARVRPLSGSEKERGCKNVVSILPGGVDIQVSAAKGVKSWRFDSCFSPDNTQADVFADTKRLMERALDGFNVCIFAYGQTGAGKTYTMSGPGKGCAPEQEGIQPRAVRELYRLMGKLEKKFKFTVTMYMCELHMTDLIDLLSPEKKKSKRPKLVVKKNAQGVVYVQNITEIEIKGGEEEVFSIIEKGAAQRHVTATKMNSESSRSHLVTSIVVKSERADGFSTQGKLTLVDLAGSERISKTGAEKETMKEGMAINKSLSALGNVISALSSGSKHVPYRDHVLTQLMQDSLGGNAKTLMFVNVSPADYNEDETKGALDFAARCKTIVNNANVSVDNDLIKKLKRELAELKKAKN